MSVTINTRYLKSKELFKLRTNENVLKLFEIYQGCKKIHLYLDLILAIPLQIMNSISSKYSVNVNNVTCLAGNMHVALNVDDVNIDAIGNVDDNVNIDDVPIINGTDIRRVSSLERGRGKGKDKGKVKDRVGLGSSSSKDPTIVGGANVNSGRGDTNLEKDIDVFSEDIDLMLKDSK
ncbi:Uncharacterized protein TCM_010143 [Theobroma cacao]|uniref:Uncharacterized protein n=1 Tax=Theobroma cacao TaxID=3641 RepID=A0A061E7H6_THECC|nr:Uncharacterized protein TCM_010143 [Theobroma cacao]